MARFLGAGVVVLSLSALAWSGGIPREVSASPSAATPESGDVIVMAAANGRDVIVALDRSDTGTPDGITDRVFRLQRDSEMDGALSRLATEIRLEDASLRFDRHSVQVFHPDFSASFGVENVVNVGQESFATGPMQSGLGRFQAVVTGSGLQRSSGSWEMTVAALQAGAAQGFACGTGNATPEGLSSFAAVAELSFTRCASGGEGSTSCSIEIAGGACSVSCASTHYACCNVLGGCKCNAIELLPHVEG